MEKRKIYGTILGGIAFIAVIIAVTYARYVWRSTDTDLSFSISDSYFYCESGIENEVSSLTPVLDYRNTSAVESFLVKNIGRNDTTFSISLNINDIDESLKDESLKYKIMLDSSGGSKNCASTSENGCTVVSEGDFSEAVVGINTLAETVTLPNNSKYEFYLFIYIDGNMENDVSMQSSSMSYTLDVCEVVVFFDYNGGSGDKSFLKVTDKYTGLPNATKNNTVINFDSNGGGSADSQTVSYTFGGWYKEAEFTNKINEGASVTETTNHTLHARWDMTDSSGSTGDGCITLPTITKPGYAFGGWYKDEGLTSLAGTGTGGSSYCVSRDTNSGNTTLYAKWNPITYYLNYSLNGGTKGSGSPSSSKYAANVTIPNPTKTVTISGNVNGTGATIGSAVIGKYVFAGWNATNLNTDTALYGTSTGSITNSWDGTTKVKGTSSTYFKNLNATNGATVTMTANWDDLTVKLPTISKEGYTCKWSKYSDGSGTEYDSGGNYTIDGDNTEVLVTVYAKCEPKKVNITYDYGINQTFSYGTYMDTDWKVNWDENFTINTTLKVPSTGNRYLIFGNYDSSDSKALSLELTTENKIRLIIGNDESDDSISTIAIAANQNIDVAFTWNASGNTYNITATGGIIMTGIYDASGISNNNLRIGTVDYRTTNSPFYQITISKFSIKTIKGSGSTFNDLPDSPSRLGYLLDGWYTASTGGTKITTSTIVGNAATYYARWIKQNYGVADTCQATSYNNYYTDLASSISGASAGQCITMLSNVTDTSDVTFNKNLEFNTNGYTLTRTKAINVSAGSTLTKSGSGTITNTAAGVATFLLYGSLTATEGTIHTASYNTIYNIGSGTFTLSGATLTNSYNSEHNVVCGNWEAPNGGKIIINSGLIKGYAGVSLYNNDTFEMYGGTIYSIADSVEQAALYGGANHNGTITISGGTIGNPSYNKTIGISYAGTGVINISGGLISANSHGIKNSGSGSITMTGGMIESGNYGIYNATGGTVNLEAEDPYNNIITIASKNMVSLYNLGVINYGEGVYTYSGVNYAVHNGGTFNLDGGRFYHMALEGDSPIYDGGTINKSGNWVSYGKGYSYSFVSRNVTLALGYCYMKQVRVVFNHRNNIANYPSSQWTLHGQSTTNGSTSAALYSDTGKWTGARVPLNSDKKKNTPYLLSVRAHRTTDFTGNFRFYTATYDSSDAVISYNKGVDINTSNLPINTWKNFDFWFNSGDYASWNSIGLDFDTANQGPVYVADVRLDEISYGHTNFTSAMPSITVPTRTGYNFKGYYTTDSAIDMEYSFVSVADTNRKRISTAIAANGWGMTTADEGTHIQAKIVVTNPVATPRLTFNDVFLDSSQYMIEQKGTTYIFYIDFDVTSEMVSSRDDSYDTLHRFIDIHNVNSSSGVNVELLTKGGKKYYDENGASVWYCDETGDSDLDLRAHWEQSVYELSLHPNGGTLSSTSGWTMTTPGNLYKNVTVGSTYGTLPTPTKTGSTFSGWTNVYEHGSLSMTASTSNYNYTAILSGIQPGVTYKVTMDSASLTAGSATQFGAYIYDFTTSKIIASKGSSFGNNVSLNLTCPSDADPNHDLRILIYSGPPGATANIGTSFTNVKITTTDLTSNTSYTSSSMVTTAANHTLFANWGLNTYTVTYDANGGSGAPAAQTKTHGTNLTLSTTIPTKSGSEFLGWNTLNNGTGTSYAAGSTYSANASVTLYAQWGTKNYGVASTCAAGTYAGYYSTLANAISGATAGQCITLLKSLTDTSTVTFNKNLSFSTNGYTLTRTDTMTVNSGVTLTKVGSGTITGAARHIVVDGNLTVSAGTIYSSSDHPVYNRGSGTVTINGGTLSNLASLEISALLVNYGAGNGGKVVMSSGLISGGIGISAYYNSSVTITGGTVKGMFDYHYAIALQSNHTGSTTISGGTIGNTSVKSRALYNYGTGSVTMSGGVIVSGHEGSAVVNGSTGTMTLYGGTVTGGPGGAVWNASTGVLNLGRSNNDRSITLSTNEAGGAVLYCGNDSSGSRAVCLLYKGATLTTSAGRGVYNYGGDYRQFEGTTVTCNGGDYYCIYNVGTTYSSASCNILGTCYYGEVYVRRGVVTNTKTAVVASSVQHSSAVYIGDEADSLYNYTSFTNANYVENNMASGPFLRANCTYTCRGVFLEDTNYSWVFKNGIVAGGTAYANKVPSSTRSSKGVGLSTRNDIAYAYFN